MRIIGFFLIFQFMLSPAFSADLKQTEDLKQWKPSQINENLQQKPSAGVFKITSLRFPMEALIFYSAIGASMYRQSLTDPHIIGGRLDPHWLPNFTEHITSPIGALSFYAFMLANGKVGQLMLGASEKFYIQSLISHPPSLEEAILGKKVSSSKQPMSFQTRLNKNLSVTFRQLAGPLGLSAGMMASRLVEEFYHDPNVRACASYLIKNTSNNGMESCDQAFYDWAIHRKVYDWAPDLASLISASLISRFGVQYIGMGLKKLSMQRLLLAIPKIGINFHPLGRGASAFAHLFVFLEIDTILQNTLVRPYKVYRKQNDLKEEFKSISFQIDKIQQTLFEENAQKTENLAFNLRLFGQRMSRFRQFRMEKAWGAYQSWSAHMSDFFQKYFSSLQFYYELYENYSLYGATQKNPFEKTDPYFGILPVGLKQAVNMGEQWTKDEYKKAQESKILQAVAWVDKNIKDKHVKPHVLKIQKLLSAVNPTVPLHKIYSSKELKKLKSSLGTEDKIRVHAVIQGLELLNQGVQSLYTDRRDLRKLRVFIGDPRPQKAGGSYLISLTNKIFKFTDKAEAYQTLNFLLLSMFCGPGENEPTVVESLKGPIFLPPKIVKGPKKLCYQYGESKKKKALIIKDMSKSSHLLSMVRKNINEALLGYDKTQNDENKFLIWWKERVDQEIYLALDKWKKEFRTVINEVFFPIFLEKNNLEKSESVIPLGVAENMMFEINFWIDLLNKYSTHKKLNTFFSVDDKAYLLDRFRTGINEIAKLRNKENRWGQQSETGMNWFNEIKDRLSTISSQQGVDAKSIKALLDVSLPSIKSQNSKRDVIVNLGFWHIIKIADELSMYQSFMSVLPEGRESEK